MRVPRVSTVVRGTVTVAVGPMEEGFYVADDGPSIPSELRETVFDHGISTSNDGSVYRLSIVPPLPTPTGGTSS